MRARRRLSKRNHQYKWGRAGGDGKNVSVVRAEQLEAILVAASADTLARLKKIFTDTY